MYKALARGREEADQKTCVVKMKTAAILLALSCCVVGPALAKTFLFKNNHGSTVWIGTLGNAGLAAPNGGGFTLGANAQVTVTTADNWAGRFWARTGCNFDGAGNGHCDTGDCGNKLACNGAGGVPPVSLAEFTLGGYGNQDFYDVSFVDGSNVALQITPMNKSPGGTYSCNTAGCLADLNNGCPGELQQKNSGGAVVACKSACAAFNTDQYCCRGSYGTPATCKSTTWPVNYPAYFKGKCPNAYSYAYDDNTSTYTCNDSGYVITVGG